MKECLGRELGYRINRDLPLARGVSLTISVRASESDLFNIEDSKRSRGVPLRQCWRREFFAHRLTDDEPARLVHKGGVSMFFVRLVFIGLRIFIAALAGDWHA